MEHAMRVGLLTLLLAACASPAPKAPSPATDRSPTTTTAPARVDGDGRDYRHAIQFSGIRNPLAFSQKQQEWLWLHYRDWKKLGQALREHNGVQYDEVTLVNARGEQRVLYFRMPVFGKR